MDVIVAVGSMVFLVWLLRTLIGSIGQVEIGWWPTIGIIVGIRGVLKLGAIMGLSTVPILPRMGIVVVLYAGLMTLAVRIFAKATLPRSCAVAVAYTVVAFVLMLLVSFAISPASQ